MDEKIYKSIKHDINWLSFNYRMLMETDDYSLPIYECIDPNHITFKDIILL